MLYHVCGVLCDFVDHLYLVPSLVDIPPHDRISSPLQFGKILIEVKILTVRDSFTPTVESTNNPVGLFVGFGLVSGLPTGFFIEPIYLMSSLTTVFSGPGILDTNPGVEKTTSLLC